MIFYKTYIKEHFALFVFVFAIWSVSAIGGIYTAMTASDVMTNDITSYIETVLNTPNSFLAVLKNGITANLKYSFLLCVSASFIIFIPLGIFLVGFKGFSAGFTTSFIIRLYGIRGMGVTLTSVVIPLFFSLPFFFMMFMLSVQFPVDTFKMRKHISSDERLKMHIIYLTKMIILFLFISLVTLVEAFLSPYMFSPLTK